MKVVWVTECRPSCHAAKAMVKLEACRRHYRKLYELIRAESTHQIRARGLRIIEENDRNLNQLRFHIHGLASELKTEQERCHFSCQNYFRVPPPPERPPEEYHPPPPEESSELESDPGGNPGEAVDAWEKIAALADEIEEIQRRQQRQQRAVDEEVAAKRQLRQELIVAHSALV